MAHSLLDRRRPGAAPDPVRPPDPVRARFDRAYTALRTARPVLARGWLQHGWYDAPRPLRPPGQRLRRPERPPTPDEVRAACLVAAVAVAAHQGGPRLDVLADAGPALDTVWDALWESRGQLGAPAAGRAAAPAVRAARMRALVTWNDEPGRTRAEVLELVDRAISRAVFGALATHPR